MSSTPLPTQKKRAGLSTRGTLVQATGSGHDIALDQPELVLDALRLIMKETA